jgi:galactonate dehydratase
LSQLDAFTVAVSEKTTWILLRLTGEDGVTGAGEATLNGLTNEVLATLPSVVKLIGEDAFSAASRLSAVRRAIPGMIGRVIASALEQAWLDREGKRLGRPVHALLGGAYRNLVPCYANINRGTLSRSPEEFAERAALAISDGYGAVKLAPFDGVMPDATDEAERDAAVAAGFQRIEAVVEQLDGKAAVQVDCHSRFRPGEAGNILERIAAAGVTWFEEPLAETSDAREAIASLRHMAQHRGIRLAGAEKCSDTHDFLPFIAGRCYDVIMPDILLAGGPGEVVRVGHLAAGFDCGVSLHNPCGPVMDMHSVHAAAAVPVLHSLERQFRETQLYDAVVTDREHHLRSGSIEVSDASGLGLRVNWTHPAVLQQATFDLDL